MTGPKLIYYEILNYTPENRDLLAAFFDVKVLPDPGRLTTEDMASADVLLAPLGYYLGREIMDAAANLKVIGSNTTGHPHIDVDYAREKGVTVVTLKGEHEFLDTITPTAELAWGLMIALTRNLIPAHRSVMAGKWSRWPFCGEKMLSRMSLGIVGLGRLGRKVAGYGHAAGMTVRYFDPYVSRGPDWIQPCGTLEELVGLSGIVSLHVPQEPETNNLFNRSIFQAFKPGSFFINTARGELVDHRALVEALEDGRLAGAAVDVLDEEFEPGFENRVSDHPLVRYAGRHPNVIITPHIGGSTRDAWHLTQEFTIRRIVEAMGLEQAHDE